MPKEFPDKISWLANGATGTMIISNDWVKKPKLWGKMVHLTTLTFNNRCFSKNISGKSFGRKVGGLAFNSWENRAIYSQKKRLVDSREVSKIINNPSNFLSWYDTSFSLWVLTFCPSPKNRITIHHVVHRKKWDHEKFWHYYYHFSKDKLRIRLKIWNRVQFSDIVVP